MFHVLISLCFVAVVENDLRDWFSGQLAIDWYIRKAIRLWSTKGDYNDDVLQGAPNLKPRLLSHSLQLNMPMLLRRLLG